MAVAIIILAAGAGTRMKSDLPKVLHKIAGAPMLWHVVSKAQKVKPDRLIVVTGTESTIINSSLLELGINFEIVIQEKPHGTGDAVAATREKLQDFNGKVIVLYGDTPLISLETLDRLANQQQPASDLTILGFHANDPKSYGRLVLDALGNLQKIVEYKDANAVEKNITFCNSGVVVAESTILFDLINKITNSNSSSEFYLTDIVEIATRLGFQCQAIECHENETLGVNNNTELMSAEAVFQDFARTAAMSNGVKFSDPRTVYFSYDTILKAGCMIEPFVVFGLGVHVENDASIRSFSYLEGCTIHNGAIIGPYARIRPQSIIGKNAKIGNFVEIKQSSIGDASKASHLSYIGDAAVGQNTNIGAGTITCNYDGKSKHNTTIGDNVLIGSDTILVSPVNINDAAMTGAGSVITTDVPAGALGISRTRQSMIKGFTERFLKKK